MIQRLINSKDFVAFILTAATGMALYFYIPFPEGNPFLQLMATRAPLVFQGTKWSYTLFLFSTPYIVYSVLLSGLYIFALKAHRKITAGRLPRYSDPGQRKEVFLVVGEIHNPRKPVPSETPRWLIIPQRGFSPESQSSARLAQVRRVAACTRLSTSFSLTKLQIPRKRLAGSCSK